jgi:hypothetical protein
VTTDIEPSVRLPAQPGRIGQATAVEQSRAIAEVQAAIVVAQQVPRDVTRAERDMRRSCAQKSLAERAFFRYPRGKEIVSGPSVQLARELARCFGNVQYGLVELRRDDGYGQSEMLAFAWDVQTNTRSSTTFIVPHRRDRQNGSVPLTDLRDIYENNANNGARRLREMIFAILPGWYTEDAVAACYATLAGEDDGKLPDRIKSAVEGFAAMGVTAAQLEQKLGGPRAKWTPYDLAQLQVLYRSLQRGEIRKEDEFPQAAKPVTVEEINRNSPPSPPVHPTAAGTPPEPAAAEAAPDGGSPPADPRPPGAAGGHTRRGKATPRQVGLIQQRFRDIGFGREDRDERLAFTAQIAGLPEGQELATTSGLSDTQARKVLAALDPGNDPPVKSRQDIVDLIHGDGETT